MTGNGEKLGDSNIIPNALNFDFLAFKSLTTLILVEMEITQEKIGTFAMLRNTLVNLEAGIHKDQASWGPIEIHAISDRLKAPRPPEDTDDQRHDFVNVADFACQVNKDTTY